MIFSLRRGIIFSTHEQTFNHSRGAALIFSHQSLFTGQVRGKLLQNENSRKRSPESASVGAEDHKFENEINLWMWS